jgi:hypothetical protein
MEAVALRRGGENVGGGRLERVRTRVETAERVPPPFLRPALLIGAALLMVAAIFLPLWGMTLASIQYPEGLRMIVYPMRMAGDIAEINALNRYIGMAQISPEYFGELRVIVGMFAASAVLCAAAAVFRRKWIAAAPLALLAIAATFGFWRMRARLYQYGHELDPTAAIEIAPFTPPMLGENQIAQFGTYSYFSWGTILPIVAAVLVSAALWLDVRGMPKLRRR